MSISKRLRFEILRRDNHTCRYCGTRAPGAALRIDHVIPVALGGSDNPSNLVASCEDCNTGKSSIAPGTPLVDDVQQDALRWSKAIAAAHELARKPLLLKQAIRDDFLENIWNEWTYQDRGNRYMLSLPGGWESSIDRFIDAGLDLDTDIREAVRLAMSNKAKDPWKYMCGICWRWIGERQQIAQELLAQDEHSRAQASIIEDRTHGCFEVPE